MNKYNQNDAFTNITSRYLTNGVINTVPPIVVLLMWTMIDGMEVTARDYLQIFKFSKIQIGLTVTHEQEEPAYRNTVTIIGCDSDLCDETVFVIADDDICTMLLSSEY